MSRLFERRLVRNARKLIRWEMVVRNSRNQLKRGIWSQSYICANIAEVTHDWVAIGVLVSTTAMGTSPTAHVVIEVHLNTSYSVALLWITLIVVDTSVAVVVVIVAAIASIVRARSSDVLASSMRLALVS